MKIRPGYILRQVMDIYVVMGIGSEAYVPNQIIRLNETGALLWGLLEQGTEKQDLVDRMVQEYDVDTQTAEKDVEKFLAQLREKALIEE